MAQLLSLSNEILLEILSYFYITRSRYYTASLARITLMCRRLHTLAIDILLEKVELDCSTDEWALFLRAIKNNPTLGPRVHFLDLKWNDFVYNTSSPQEFLHRLPNLRHLSIKAMHSYKLDSRLYVLPPSRPPDRCFYEMDIHLEEPSPQDISDLLLNNRVHILNVTIPRTNNIPKIPIPKHDQAHTAPLQSFATVGATKISTYNLHNLLTYPRALTHLSIALPGTENHNHRGLTTGAQMGGPIAPSAIARSLLPTAHSLHSLRIHGHMQRFNGHDGTRSSLREFAVLETATLSSRLFFSDDASLDPTGFYELLPPSICKITINFDFNSSIPRTDTNVTSLKWLLEIADHHETHTPHLRLIELCENERPWLQRHGTSSLWAIEIWEVPEEVRMAFEGKGVEIRGRVRETRD